MTCKGHGRRVWEHQAEDYITKCIIDPMKEKRVVAQWFFTNDRNLSDTHKISEHVYQEKGIST